MNQESRSKQIQFWLGIVISLLCVVAIFAIIKPGDIWGVIREADTGLLLLALAGLLLFLVFRAIRWRFMLNSGVEGADLIAYPSRAEILNEHGLLGRSVATFSRKIISILQRKYDEQRGTVYGKKFL